MPVRKVASDPSERSPLLGEQNGSHAQNVDAEQAQGQSTSTQEDGAETTDVPHEMYAKMHILVPALAIGLLLSALDQLITVASYAKMGNDLNALNSVGWVATSYLLTLTSAQPLYGKLSDIFGRKEALLFGYAVFGASCFFCGIAQNMLQLCIARAFAGIGGGGMTAVVAILLSDIVPLRERGVWQGYINLIYAIGTSTGAPLGGILADSIGWRWAFIAQAPLCAVAFIAVYLVLELPRRSTDHLLDKVRRIDFLGAFVLITAIVNLFMGLDYGSNEGWDDLRAIIPLAVSPALFAAFIYVEMRIASNPFAPGHVIFHRGLFAYYLCNMFEWCSYYACLFYLPLYFQAVKGYSAGFSGLLLVPQLVTSVCASMASGIYMKRSGKFYWITVWSFFVMMATYPVMILGMYYEKISLIIGACAVIAIGAGSAVTTTLIGLLANAAEEDTAVVVACSYLFRSLGCSIGVTITSAVLQQVLRYQLSYRLPNGDEAREIEERVRLNLDAIKDLPKALAAVVRVSYKYASVASTAPMLMFAALAFIVSFWAIEKPLKR